MSNNKEMTGKILVIDDDADSLKLIEIMLKRHNYQTVTADSGKLALEKAETEQPDLVILDVMIPDMNGLEICRRLRSSERTRSISIIIFTAKSLVDDKLKGFEAGADDYLTKPIHPNELADRVKTILSRKTTQSQKPQISVDGLTIGVLGAKGGVGTSTIALNLASALTQLKKKVVIADFNLGNGSLGLFTGGEQSDNITKLLDKSLDEINLTVVQNHLSLIQDGLYGLFTSAQPSQVQNEFQISTARGIIDYLRQIADWSIYDLGSRYTTRISTLQADMNQLLIISDSYPITLTTMQNLIRDIKQGEEDERIQTIIVNRNQSLLMPNIEQLEEILDRKIQAVVSTAPDLVFQAMQKQIPMVQLQPNAIASSQIRQLAQTIMTKYNIAYNDYKL